MRRQGRHPAEAQLASEAIARWPTLAEELDADLQYRQGGNLFLAKNDEQAASLLDFVREQQVAQAWCGLEAICIDEIPFIGPVAKPTNLTLALGFSGHGFALAPAVGRAVADQLSGRATPELDGLSPARLGALHTSGPSREEK